MLTKLTIDYRIPEKAEPSVHWGSLFHGILMKLLPSETATELHKIALRPYAQYVELLEGNRLRWHIGIWDKETVPLVLRAVMGQSQVELTGRDVVLTATGSTHESVPVLDFMEKHLVEQEPNRRYEIKFKTPCTHKSAEQYALFPSMALIYQNLAKRLSAFDACANLYDGEVIAQLAAHTQVTRYALKSAPYYLEGTKILGYTGYLCVCTYGPDTLIRLSGLLLSLANYMGVGIKTAMGMGGCTVEPKQAYPQTGHVTNR